MPVGVIGGSGLYEIDDLKIEKQIPVFTPFGEPSAYYTIGTLGQKVIIFLPRHGTQHQIPPHKVNYRANIWGFKSLGIDKIISVSAVGGISTDIFPGSIVLPDQIIDLTGGARSTTYYDEGKVVHVDLTEPYCAEMRGNIIKASEDIGLTVKNRGTYVCVNGPRLETAKEIRFFSQIGGDVVGMTAMPEAALARELELCFSAISVVTNYAAGMSGSKLTTTEIADTMKQSMQRVKALLKQSVLYMPAYSNCFCKEALKGAAFE